LFVQEQIFEVLLLPQTELGGDGKETLYTILRTGEKRRGRRLENVISNSFSESERKKSDHLYYYTVQHGVQIQYGWFHAENTYHSKSTDGRAQRFLCSNLKILVQFYGKILKKINPNP
jgi:hypothetical protein